MTGKGLARDTERKQAYVKVVALVYAMADTLAAKVCETLGITLVEVYTEALLNSQSDMKEEVVAETLSEHSKM